MARILVVDDDALFCEMMRQDLLHEGHRPLVVNSGAEALTVLRSGERVDLVLTDIMMPDMDGIELIQAVRLVHPTLPIIAVSSAGEVHSSYIFTTARMLGADCVFQKPVSVDVIGSIIHRLLPAEPALTIANDDAPNFRMDESSPD
jgi:CheY-like chemotaxis protein